MPVINWRLRAAAVLLLTMATGAWGKEKPWFRYDNQHFTAYSNGTEKTARRLLEDLEEFRAAFMQVGNIEIPAEAPPTIVIITATDKEFDRLKIGKNVAGFASYQEGRTVIVQSAMGGEVASTIIRHEYGHALLRYKKVPYPAWYEEGFAEIASSVKLVKRGKSFVFGLPTTRAIYNGPPVYPWEDLFSDEFSPHAITSSREGSSAYFQAWLMAHYATLADNGANAQKLQRYLVLVNAGEPPLQSFRMAFGFEAADAWQAALEDYSRHMPSYTIKFNPGALDLGFSRKPADGGEFRPMLNYFEVLSVARYRADPPANPLQALAGRWAEAHLTRSCERPFSISISGDALSMTMQEEGEAPQIDRFRVSQDTDSPEFLQLSWLEADGKTAVPDREPMALEMRSATVACWWPENENTGCRRILSRCSP